MIAADYARKSTDQHVADEEKSVTRQVERALAYTARQGWTVADEHVYRDDAIAGAEFVKRPAYLQLMGVLEPRPPFHAPIVMKIDRLGREKIETSDTLKRVVEAGVRVFE